MNELNILADDEDDAYTKEAEEIRKMGAEYNIDVTGLIAQRWTLKEAAHYIVYAAIARAKVEAKDVSR